MEGPPSPQADTLTQLMDAAEEAALFATIGTVADGTTATVTVGDALTGEYVITCTPRVQR